MPAPQQYNGLRNAFRQDISNSHMSLLDEYRALRGSAAIVDRSARGRLLVKGADRRSYLQGLLSNDIVALTPGSGCYATYLTAQGRMIADMRVFELGDTLLVDLDPRVAQPVAGRWSQFIFSEDVQIEDVSARTIQLGVYGPRAVEVLVSAFGADATAKPSGDPDVLRSLPVYSNACWKFQGDDATLVASDEIGVRGFDVVLPANRRDAFAAELRRAGAVDATASAAEICRVEGGRPLFLTDMHEDTIPLEAGIEDRAISLTKGCYVGQEIIIRVLHRGHGRVARKLVGITLEPGAAVPAPQEVVRAGGKETGTITSAIESPALGRPIALGYVHRDAVEPGTLLDISGVPASVAALPFVPVTPLV
jgi:folate-binding protein YgfZ